MFFLLLLLVHSAQHAAPIDRRRGQKDEVKGHSVQQRGDFHASNHISSCSGGFRPVVGLGGAWGNLNIMHLKTNKHKRQTQSQCNPNRRRLRTQATPTGQRFSRELNQRTCEKAKASSGSKVAPLSLPSHLVQSK